MKGASGPAANSPPPDADFLVMSSLTYDENGEFGITLKLVRADDSTIVWADTKHLAAEELATWPALAAVDLVQALQQIPAG